MGISFWHLLLVLLVVMILFGPGRLSGLMGDIGKGVRNLREGMKDEGEASKRIDNDKEKDRIG